jgi:hypothetical protein
LVQARIIESKWQAMSDYRAELALWGASSLEVAALGVKCTEVCDASQCTAFESHLARSLKKPAEEQGPSIVKYRKLFAKVKPSAVQPALWAASSKFLSEELADET